MTLIIILFGQQKVVMKYFNSTLCSITLISHHSLLYQYCLQTAINLITQSLGVLLPNLCADIFLRELIQSCANNKPGYYKTDWNVNITVVFIDNRSIFISAQTQMHWWQWQRHNIIKTHWHRHNLYVCYVLMQLSIQVATALAGPAP